MTIILTTFKKHGKMYGYEIFLKVKEISAGKIELKDGSLYPALQRMQKDGLIEDEVVHIGKRVRRYYTLTKEGSTRQQEMVEELADFIKTIQELTSIKSSIA